jgi:hypothetical protein
VELKSSPPSDSQERSFCSFILPEKNTSNFKFETLFVEKAQQQTKTPEKQRKRKEKNSEPSV